MKQVTKSIISRYLEIGRKAYDKLSHDEFQEAVHLEQDLIDIGILIELIAKEPGELAFVVDCKDYDAYLQTYTDAGCSAKDALYTKQEFDILKNYFIEENS